MDQLQRLQQDMDEITRRVNEISGQAGQQTTAIGAVSPINLQPVVSAVAIPAANQVRNGDQSHSVNTWNQAAPAAAAQDYESAFWFSHDAPVAAQTLSETDGRTNPVNQTLKGTAHANYSASYSDWLISTGVARFQGTKTIDAPLPANTAVPGRQFCIGAIISRRSEQIVIPDDCHIFAGIWDNTAGQRDFLKAGSAFAATATVRGAPATTTERRYKIFARTDRGYTFLSTEATLVGAPSDAAFSAGADVYLSWTRIDGILEYWVYRFDVTAAKYRLLRKIGSGANTYGDNNSILAGHDNEGAYPVATDDRGKSYVATETGALANIAVDGVAVQWSNLFLNIPVPGGANGYQQSVTTDKQWLRFGLTKALDRQVTDAVSTAANTSVSSATAAFAAQDTGRLATLTSGTNVHGPEAITFVDATHVTFATAVAFNSAGATLYIVGGGDHGLQIDLIHASYLPQAAYAPYPDDTNRLANGGQNPIARPDGSSQGGVPGGGGGGSDPGEGGLGCVEVQTPVAMVYGHGPGMAPFIEGRRGDLVFGGGIEGNIIQDIHTEWIDDLHIVRFQNGIELPCSPRHRIFTSALDRNGTAASRLRPGDFGLTCVYGCDERSRVKEVVATGQRAQVGTYVLAPRHIYLAGRLKLPWWKRLIRKLQGRRGVCGVYSHNRKPEQ